MKIENTEITVKFDVRQAQSLLMFMREIEGLSYQWRGTERLPTGVMDDVKETKTDFERLLQMIDQRR